ESAGVIRAVLKKGETGAISAADAFNVVPLGSSPTGDGSIGYPLVRANVFLLELRGVFELALAQGAMNSDLDIGMSGMKVEYDATRPTATTEQELLDPTKGQVMRILVDTNHADGYEQFDTVLYDRTQGVGNNTQLVSVITSSYIAQFAGDAGVTLKDDAGNPVDADKTQAVIKSVLHRSDASEIKQLESFLGWIYAAPGGTLPDVYDKASPNATQRWVCTNGC
ncbi:MAG TPA: hypothetical protein VHB21_01990, partial [Minicystis sp.]|nr:hypothetical protein [Minicystis sp.]